MRNEVTGRRKHQLRDLETLPLTEHGTISPLSYCCQPANVLDKLCHLSAPTQASPTPPRQPPSPALTHSEVQVEPPVQLTPPCAPLTLLLARGLRALPGHRYNSEHSHWHPPASTLNSKAPGSSSPHSPSNTVTGGEPQSQGSWTDPACVPRGPGTCTLASQEAARTTGRDQVSP